MEETFGGEAILEKKYVSVVGRVRLGMWEQIGCQNRHGLLSVGGQLDPLSSFA